MNTEIQKKWFIYVQDHHEGPFSVEELLEKQNSKLIAADSYSWCEGMADWKMIRDIPELFSELEKLGQVHSPAITPPTKESAEQEYPEPTRISTILERQKALEAKKKSKTLPLILAFTMTVVIAFGTLVALSRYSSEDFHSKIRPTLSKMLEQFPFLTGIIKVAPQLSDVKANDLKDLEAAMIGQPEVEVKIAFALSTTDFNRPYFYVSSNLPTGTKLDISLFGNSDTLLNKLQFYTQTTTLLNHGLAKSDVLLGDGAQPLPKGEYQVYVSESNEQDENIKSQLAQFAPIKIQNQQAQAPQGTRFLVTKTFFMGGERDQTYLTRLKAFHDKVKENAAKELQELRQYSETLSSQFTTLTHDFEKYQSAKKITPSLKAAWKKRIDQWLQINSQLDQTMQTWTKETLQNEFFYGKVYELVKSATEGLKKLFEIENNFALKPQDKAAFDIEHAKTLSETKAVLDLLQSKVTFITHSPKTSTGLPTREGL